MKSVNHGNKKWCSQFSVYQDFLPSLKIVPLLLPQNLLNDRKYYYLSHVYTGESIYSCIASDLRYVVYTLSKWNLVAERNKFARSSSQRRKCFGILHKFLKRFFHYFFFVGSWLSLVCSRFNLTVIDIWVISRVVVLEMSIRL